MRNCLTTLRIRNGYLIPGLLRDVPLSPLIGKKIAFGR
jgi:hypothetical protein